MIFENTATEGVLIIGHYVHEETCVEVEKCCQGRQLDNLQFPTRQALIPK